MATREVRSATPCAILPFLGALNGAPFFLLQGGAKGTPAELAVGRKMQVRSVETSTDGPGAQPRASPVASDFNHYQLDYWLAPVLDMLAADKQLPSRYFDHPLSGDWSDPPHRARCRVGSLLPIIRRLVQEGSDKMDLRRGDQPFNQLKLLSSSPSCRSTRCTAP
jgi:mRNA-degrading endonuclease YafQ of YafQ-DinJ toxin-antitoxin module